MIDLSPADLAILLRVLRSHHPPNTTLWAFGSRVIGTARQYSDLDLAVQGDTALDWTTLAELRDALSASDLTIKVDLVDLLAVDAAFRRIIDAGKVALPIAASSDPI
jgi:uncharacterized protein